MIDVKVARLRIFCKLQPGRIKANDAYTLFSDLEVPHLVTRQKSIDGLENRYARAR
ncbi:hypothetical protein D9M72_361310 [compost metagenome]